MLSRTYFKLLDRESAIGETTDFPQPSFATHRERMEKPLLFLLLCFAPGSGLYFLVLVFLDVGVLEAGVLATGISNR